MSDRTTMHEIDDGHDAFLAKVRADLDHGCTALDGHTLSRLNRIRHAALETRQRPRRTPLLLPFGGLVSACMLVVAIMVNDGVAPTDPAANTTPIEDLELLTSAEELDFYENYEFYQWLADSGSSI